MLINLTKNEEQLTSEVMSKINLSKDQDKFKDSVVNLSKTIVNLSKKADVDLGATKAQVVVALDYSGSMSAMYNNGTVQSVVDRLLPIGLTFDDNGEVEVFRFADGSNIKPIDNYDGYIKNKVMAGYMGGTDYAPVLNEIKSQYIDGTVKTSGFFARMFGRKEDKRETLTGADASINPVFVIFITDGDNSDKRNTDDIIRELSRTNCFIQFVGVGDDSMSYLEKLDDLDGRECDNTGFVRFSDINKVCDAELYEQLLGQFADWLKVKGF